MTAEKRKFNLWQFLLCLAIPLVAGGVAALITRSSMEMYGQLQKPPLSPPGVVFPIVWTILYLLMGIASYLVLRTRAPLTGSALILYGIQLLVNVFWPILFFGMRLYLAAFLWLILLIILLVATIVLFYKVSKPTAWLLVPYLLWCLFAAYLNYGVYLLNS